MMSGYRNVWTCTNIYIVTSYKTHQPKWCQVTEMCELVRIFILSHLTKLINQNDVRLQKYMKLYEYLYFNILQNSSTKIMSGYRKAWTCTNIYIVTSFKTHQPKWCQVTEMYELVRIFILSHLTKLINQNNVRLQKCINLYEYLYFHIFQNSSTKMMSGYRNLWTCTNTYIVTSYKTHQPKWCQVTEIYELVRTFILSHFTKLINQNDVRLQKCVNLYEYLYCHNLQNSSTKTMSGYRNVWTCANIYIVTSCKPHQPKWCQVTEMCELVRILILSHLTKLINQNNARLQKFMNLYEYLHCHISQNSSTKMMSGYRNVWTCTNIHIVTSYKTHQPKCCQVTEIYELVGIFALSHLTKLVNQNDVRIRNCVNLYKYLYCHNKIHQPKWCPDTEMCELVQIFILSHLTKFIN